MLLHVPEWNPLFRSLHPPLQYSGTVLVNHAYRIETLENALLPDMLQQQLLKRTSAFKETNMKITDDFREKLKPTCAYHKASKDEWDTKEGCGKSMKNALYAQWHGKKHLSG